VGLFYGNKTQYALHSFQPQLSWSEENQVKLTVQVKPVDPILEAGAQIQQMINAECIDDYNGTFGFGIFVIYVNYFSNPSLS
jgi:AP-2 complex subunit alpha